MSDETPLPRLETGDGQPSRRPTSSTSPPTAQPVRTSARRARQAPSRSGARDHRSSAKLSGSWPVALGLVLILGIVAFGPTLHEERTDPLHQLQRRAATDVAAVFREIGGGLRAPRVLVARGSSCLYANYDMDAELIRVNADRFWSDDHLLMVVAHECVHALFMRAGPPNARTSLVHELVEEATAQVLGAHLAGRVISSRGGDGGELTQEYLVRYYLWCLDDAGTERRPRDSAGRRISGLERLIYTHKGTPELVDDLNEICLGTGDARKVVPKVKDRYHLSEPAEPSLPGL